MAEGGSLKIIKVPDKSEGERVVRFDSETGERKLVNPATPGEDHEAWPLLGVKIENQNGDEGPPATGRLSTSYVAQARAEGWIEVEGERVVYKPAGPPENPHGQTHTFVQLDSITFKSLDGDITYDVVHNPDKYDEDGNPTDVVGDPTTRVDWFYDLELANG